MSSSLASFSEQLATLTAQASESIVAIHARPRFNSSGVHWSPGVIVTAEHTLRHDDEIVITTPDGSKHQAELAGRDPGTDLAVLRVKDLAIPVAPKSAVVAHRAGSLVLAVGRNLESANSALGVISNVTGASQTWRGGKLDQVIRLDLTLHPAAAGGAVIDVEGNLIGIATDALSRVSVFAIPLTTVERVTSSILAHGKIRRGYLGAGLQPIVIPEHLKSSLGLTTSRGLMAVSVDEDAPAGKAGMLIGDVLLELDGNKTDQPMQVRTILAADSVGKTLTARLLRGGQLVSLDITIAERKEN
ncbi:MAG TPA: trypsin-like peptidase domain-containing protein [Bryobacteraceae bacterium]|jgi:S1-C subfamily serine protease